MLVVFELPVFLVALTRLGIMTTDKLRKNRRMGYFACGVVGMAVAPSVDPVTTTLQAVPLFVLFELLDRASARSSTADRRTARTPPSRRQAAISAGWVLPGRGSSAGGTRTSRGRTIGSRRSGPAVATAHLTNAMMLPGLVNAHSHLEYAVYAGFGDGESRRWLGTHICPQAGARVEDMVAIARRGAADSLGAGITTTADYSFSGAAALAAAELGLRATVYLEVFGADPDQTETPVHRAARTRRARPASSRLGVSPHAPYTCSVEVYGWCLSLGVPVGTHLAESAGENEWLLSGNRPLRPDRAVLVAPTGHVAPVATLADVLGPELLLRALRRLSTMARSAGSPAPTCRWLTAHARTRCSAAGRRRWRSSALPGFASGSAPTRPRPRRRSTYWTELRGANTEPGPENGGPTSSAGRGALQLATPDASTALGLDHRGREPHTRQARRPNCRVSRRKPRTIQSKTQPWQPVFGGSPDRVLETIVDGETRYRQGETAWPEVRCPASAARRRMLA